MIDSNDEIITETEECFESDEAINEEENEKLFKKLEEAIIPKKRGRGRPKRGRGAISPKLLTVNKSSSKKQQRECSPASASTAALITILSDSLMKLNDQVGSNYDNIERKLDSLLQKVDALEAENKILKKDLQLKDASLVVLQERVDKLEMKGRRNQVYISSPEIETLDEKEFKPLMVDLVASKLNISPAALTNFSYRKVGLIGKRKALVEVDGHQSRSQLFVSARKKRPANFFVNEVLIKSRDQLFFEVRRLRKTSAVKFSTYTFFGEVYIKKTPQSTPVLVRKLDDVTSMM